MRPAQKVIKYFAMAFAISLIVVILTGITTAINGISMGSGWISDVNYIDFTLEYDEVNNLDITNYSGDLYIRDGNVAKVTVMAKKVPDTTVVEIKGGKTLTVKNDDGVKWFLHFIGSEYNEESEIVIIVPQGFTVEKAVFDNHSGKMELRGITASELEISGGSGDIIGSDLSAQKTDIETGSGRLEFDDVSLKNGNFDSGSGSVKLTDAELANMKFEPGSGSLSVEGSLTGDNRIEGHSGNITFELSNRLDSYELKLSAGSGNIWINGEKRNNKDYHGENAENELIIKSGSGKVVVNFTE